MAEAHAAMADAHAERIADWQRRGKQRADASTFDGASTHPTDAGVRGRSARQDRLARKVFRWIGKAMQEGTVEFTADDGHEGPGLAA
eukprot:191179-Pyramimonas_sp.AAC.1